MALNHVGAHRIVSITTLAEQRLQGNQPPVVEERPRQECYLISAESEHPRLIESVGTLTDGSRIGLSISFPILSSDLEEDDENPERLVSGGFQATLRNVIRIALGDDYR